MPPRWMPISSALAIEHGATLCTNDRDFLRFPSLRVEFALQ